MCNNRVQGGCMSELSERFKNTLPWASTAAERAAAVRERAKMNVPEGDKTHPGAVPLQSK